MRVAPVLFLLISVICGSCCAQTSEELRFDIHAVDKSADPCVDFYQYACGGWLKKNPIPADRAYSAVFQQMREINQKRVAGIMEQTSSAPCFVRQYSAYTAVDDVKVNGELTLGENIADNGGLQLAHMAFETRPHSSQSIDGYTPEQRFFLGWAQWRCMNVTEQKARELSRNDSHSPGRWRVNGVVSNMPAFAKAYGCRQGDLMVTAEPCRIW